MDQQIDNGELTFKKLGQKLKRSWIRMLVWSIILVVFASTTMGLFAAFTTDHSFTAKIMFSNEYINEGMSPWDTTFNPSKEIKSTYIVQQALANVGLDEDTQIAKLPQVLSSLAVTADTVVTEKEGETTSANKFVFTVSLQNQNSLGLSRAKTQELLDEICKIYIAQYKEKYAFKNTVSMVSNDVIKQYNYVVASTLLENSLQQLIIATDQMSSVAPMFRSNKHKETFGSLTEDIKGTKVYFDSLMAYLSENGVEKQNANVPSEKAYLEQTKTELESKVKHYDKLINDIRESANKLAEAFNNMTPGASGNIIINDTNYYNLINKAVELEVEKAPYQSQLDAIDKILTGYGSSSKFSQASEETKGEMIATVDNMISSLCTKLIDQNTKFSEMLIEFNDVENLKRAIVLTQPALSHSHNKVSTMLFLMINLMMILVGCVIGVITTDKKVKKYNLTNAKADQSSDTPNQETKVENVVEVEETQPEQEK